MDAAAASPVVRRRFGALANQPWSFRFREPWPFFFFAWPVPEPEVRGLAAGRAPRSAIRASGSRARGAGDAAALRSAGGAIELIFAKRLARVELVGQTVSVTTRARLAHVW